MHRALLLVALFPAIGCSPTSRKAEDTSEPADTDTDADSDTETTLGSPTFVEFFDIHDAAEGDVFLLLITKAMVGVNPNVAYVGLTFD